MRVPSRRFLGCCVLLVLAGLLATGCSGGKGDVKGKVAYKGKPIGFGWVIMHGATGIPVQGDIQPDGSYVVRGVPVGAVKVAVHSPNPRTLVQSRDNKGKAAPPSVEGWAPIPLDFSDPNHSRLTTTVKRGSANAYDIDLPAR